MHGKRIRRTVAFEDGPFGVLTVPKQRDPHSHWMEEKRPRARGWVAWGKVVVPCRAVA